MFWIFPTALFIGILILILLLASKNNKMKNNNESKEIIQGFEPDNAAPALSEMIEYHKKNDTVKYEVK